MFDPINKLSTLFALLIFLLCVILTFIPYLVYRHKRKKFKAQGYVPYDYDKFDHFCNEFPWRSYGVMATGIVIAFVFFIPLRGCSSRPPYFVKGTVILLLFFLTLSFFKGEWLKAEGA